MRNLEQILDHVHSSQTTLYTPAEITAYITDYLSLGKEDTDYATAQDNANATRYIFNIIDRCSRHITPDQRNRTRRYAPQTVAIILDQLKTQVIRDTLQGKRLERLGLTCNALYEMRDHFHSLSQTDNTGN